MTREKANKEHRELEDYFRPFRAEVVGQGMSFKTPYGEKELIYADWTASGRLYSPIEDRLHREMGPFVANTHTETSTTGKVMTLAYQEARKVIKDHVRASSEDVLITCGTGMTEALIKFQRILGFKLPEPWSKRLEIKQEDRPVVFISHMEHHSNQTSWLETIAEVVIIPANEEGHLCLDRFADLLKEYSDRPQLIASLTACSNVTGIETPYREVAQMIHSVGGRCFVDFACSAPYVSIDMHPEENDGTHLDAVVFSPHKFLGGPGSSGVLIFHSSLYNNEVPDAPGGGTVSWTNPWGGHRYFDNIEAREDGGTPGFLQAIRAAMAIKLKEKMGVEKILHREHQLMDILLPGMRSVSNLHVLAGHISDRLGIISFYIDGLHFNLAVRLFNDRFGIQTRGGCSCAGTYGHFLLDIEESFSKDITNEIDKGHFSNKPGWVRLSIHPVMTNEEAHFLVYACQEVAKHWEDWAEDYVYNPGSNEYDHKELGGFEKEWVASKFSFI
ncbi:MAG: Cysteine desulfurase SufS [Flavobacteriia bacterium]|nr:MAG: Cysteine desulfurase SufS [Flavobacteriia bacterium]